MADVAIAAEGLSKRYRLGAGAHRYGRLTESLSTAFAAPFRKLSRRGGPSPSDEFLWALKDVSFEVTAGELWASSGGTGRARPRCSKFSLASPSPQRDARSRGRVGSLLEVGTGFHPELTGRENVYLNGAILGMSRADITKRFDEIVDSLRWTPSSTRL